ncbi:hypothetical protein PVK06_012782 [Gossypium arboreum]|uniref:Uncharacterized protein n=1 Tax=Gossypium arboreum TaxID=29729 RepID=A0ABR0QD67_GOSAR|nr:hypothetical protein PVK06_012782 [Gossypium arboreum]
MEKQRKDGEAGAVPIVIDGMVLDIQATSSIPPHPRTTCLGQKLVVGALEICKTMDRRLSEARMG